MNENLLESFSDYVKNEKINEGGKMQVIEEDDHLPGAIVTLKSGASGTVQSWDESTETYIVLTDDNETVTVTDAELVKESKETKDELLEKDVKDKAALKEFVYAMYKEAFGDKFDEKKADAVIDGLVKKYKDDWGAMVGAAKNSLGA